RALRLRSIRPRLRRGQASGQAHDRIHSRVQSAGGSRADLRECSRMTKPTVKVVEIAFARLQAPDLDQMEEFLTEFGMFKSARTDTALYMRGTDPSHHLHVTHKGAPGFISFAYRVQSEDDLKALAALPGASGIEQIDEPAGGKRVRVRDPFNG